MDAACVVKINGMEYKAEIENLHHHFFNRSLHSGLHSHPAYHLIFISRGQCHVRFANAAPILLPIHTLLLINPNVPHAFIPDPEDGVEHTACIWRFRDAAGRYALFPLQEFSDGEVPVSDYMTRLLNPVESASYVQLHRQVELSYLNGKAFDLSCDFFRIWLTGYRLISGHCRDIAPRLFARENLVQQIETLIDMNFCYNDFNISYLAGEMHKHPNYLNTLFIKARGTSIGKVIQIRRIEHAKSMLEGTNMKVAEIADQCGFSRQSYFARAFKVTLGMTPSEYRNRIAARD